MSTAVSHTVTRTAACPREHLFDVVVAEDVLPKVLHRYRMLPAVTGTAELTGPWTQPGSQRRVLLADGSSLREQLTIFDRPDRFGYRVDDFPQPLRALVGHAAGSWEFADTATGSSFRWTYRFVPLRSVFTPAVRAFVATMWSGYMSRCADACVTLAQA
jgi:hypothetical protein